MYHAIAYLKDEMIQLYSFYINKTIICIPVVATSRNKRSNVT